MRAAPRSRPSARPPPPCASVGPPPVDGFVANRLADLDRRVDDLLGVRAALVSLADAPPEPGACPVIDALGQSDEAAEELLG